MSSSYPERPSKTVGSGNVDQNISNLIDFERAMSLLFYVNLGIPKCSKTS